MRPRLAARDGITRQLDGADRNSPTVCESPTFHSETVAVCRAIRAICLMMWWWNGCQGGAGAASD